MQRRDVELPVGEWGGRLGSLLASDFRAGLTHLLEGRTALESEEGSELLGKALQEFEERHATMTLVVAHGQKVGAWRPSFASFATGAPGGQPQSNGRGLETYLISREQAVAAIRAWILEHGRPPRWPEWERAKGRPSAKTIQRRWGWHQLVSEVVARDLHRRPSAYWSGRQHPRLRAFSDGEIISALQTAHDNLGRWPYATEWEKATHEHPGRRTVVRRFGSWSAATTAARTATRSSHAPARKPPTPSVQEVRWTQGAVVDAMTTWHRQQGRWPTSHDWRHAGPWWPSFGTVLARFERWAAAIAAAEQRASAAEQA